MNILAIISGEYGQRHIDNININGPNHWDLKVWNSPTTFPLMIDYPEDFLPESFPAADLILSFAEHKGVAELLPDIAEMTGAKSVIVAVDNENWLPRGLDRQLHSWLAKIDVTCVTPKPLCSLTEYDYGVTRRDRVAYDDRNIKEFAHHFGKPELDIKVDPKTRKIISTSVIRDAVCGCAQAVSEGLIGVSVDDAVEKSGLLHHHYPCLASMTKLIEFNHDTLMHESGNIIKENVKHQVSRYKTIRYISPGKRSSD